MALHALRASPDVRVVGLLSTMTEDYDRVSMHGVLRALVEAQAEAADLPLTVVRIPRDAGESAYAERMRRTLADFAGRGVRTVAFGDLFLEDVRRYRVQRLAEAGMQAIFPLWGRDTAELAAECCSQGFRALVTCVDTEQLDGRFSGREYDAKMLAELPDGVDPCGENGEFHTFVCDGPIFRRPVPVRRGRTVLRDGRFNFCDVRPVSRRPIGPTSG